jgi:hypothetical protein
MMNGIERIARIGLTKALTTVKTPAAISSVHHWSP